MRLKRIHVKEFKSIWDSNEIEVGDVTCFVGKNESGKTALLEALYRLNPIVPEHARFDVTDDYPRSNVEEYQQRLRRANAAKQSWFERPSRSRRP